MEERVVQTQVEVFSFENFVDRMVLTDAPEGGKVVSIRLWNLILRNAIHLYHGGTVTCYCVLFMKFSTQVQIKLNNRQCQ